MGSPQNLRFTREHEWARLEADGTITVGITEHAQEALGDVVFVELPQVGDAVSKGQPFGVVESVKTVSDVYAPCDGEVVAVNDALTDTPEQVNASAFDGGWMIRLRPAGDDPLADLLDAAAYDAFAADAH